MRLIISMATMFLATAMAWGSQPTFENGTTPYDTIVDWYAHSQAVMFKDSVGVFEGKCFHYDSKSDANELRNAVVVHSKTVSGDNGPAFPGVVENKVALVNSFFISVNGADAIADTEEYWANYKIVLDKNSPLKYQQNKITGEVRRYKRYLVTLTTASENSSCNEDDIDHPDCKNGFIPKGSVLDACYYYEKLK